MQAMKAVARRTGKFRHMIDVRGHHVTIDEPLDQGGEDSAPSPQEMLAASLASCTAVTMEMYAQRKGWDLGYVEVECSYGPADRGCPTRFELVMSGAYDVAFLLRPTPVEQVREIAAAGQSMPPKSTYFYPKVPTGLVFHPLR